MTLHGEGVRQFRMQVRTASRASADVEVTVVIIVDTAGPEYHFIYLLCPTVTAADDSRPSSISPAEARGGRAPVPAPLTPRQLEILDMLSHGANAANISRSLCISPLTVRRHVQGHQRRR